MVFQISSLSEYQELSKLAKEDNDKFWLNICKYYKWHKEPNKAKICDMQNGKAEWFSDATLNITENCLDKNVRKNPNKTALIWESNFSDQASKEISYQELLNNVCQTANMLKKLGIKKGDRVCLYMPMIVEAVYAMLAVARIGAVHSVVFAGFSANALAERITASEAKLIITADMLYRGNKKLALVDIVSEALTKAQIKSKCLVYKRTKAELKNKEYFIWQDEIKDLPLQCEAEIMQAEDPFFILYTSGSTGKPKGILHSCAGYMVYAGYSFANVFQPKPDDIYWCSADIGWITGHTYLVYGPLLNNLTSTVFEGVPTYPKADRFWQVIEKHKINIFYTSPTAIRALMKCGDEYIDKYDMKTLHTIGSVGEPINLEAWNWCNEKIGKNRCNIIDSWWQTETGGIAICNLAGITKAKATYATKPLPGIEPCLLDEEANEIEADMQTGYLCIKKPWPSMIRSVWGDHDRCIETYFSRFPGYYFSGDGAYRDSLGNYRIIGRVDDVINCSGHRLGSAEIENAINLHANINESAVIALPDKIKGEAVCAFVTCKTSNDNINDEIIKIVKNEIGSFAKPDKIIVASDLPKTRSGKIMRRILKKLVANNNELGDTSTIVNPEIITEIKDLLKKHA